MSRPVRWNGIMNGSPGSSRPRSEALQRERRTLWGLLGEEDGVRQQRYWDGVGPEVTPERAGAQEVQGALEDPSADKSGAQVVACYG